MGFTLDGKLQFSRNRDLVTKISYSLDSQQRGNLAKTKYDVRRNDKGKADIIFIATANGDTGEVTIKKFDLLIPKGQKNRD